MSSNTSSSFSRGTTGTPDTGSPIAARSAGMLLLLATCEPPSVGQDARVIVFHHVFDNLGTADDTFAFRNELRLSHVEEIEVGGAAIELYASLVGVLDEIVDSLGRSGLDHELLCYALLHQLAGRRRANHVDLVVHRRSDRGLKKRRAQLLAVARVGVDHDDYELLRHSSASHPAARACKRFALPTWASLSKIKLR